MPVTENEKAPRTPHIVAQALTVHPDEKALALVERDLLTTDYRERRRWQFVYVLRNDNVAEWTRDMGLASDYPYASEFRIYSFWEDSVAELKEQAEGMRDDDYWQRFLAEKQAESTLITEHIAFEEEKYLQSKNRSTFGPGFSRQRNLFAKKRTG